MTTMHRRGWGLVGSLCLGAILTFVLVLHGSNDPVERSLRPTPPNRAPEPVDVAASDQGLEIRARLPVRLLPGNHQQFHVEVTGPRGTPLPDDELLELRMLPELTDEARGHLWFAPGELLVTPRELPRRAFHLGTTFAMPCDTRPGTLEITARTLHVGGPSGATEVPLPARPCDLPLTPEPPASIHVKTPVCGEAWRADLRTLIAGGTPPARWCRPDDRAPEPSTTPRESTPVAAVEEPDLPEADPTNEPAPPHDEPAPPPDDPAPEPDDPAPEPDDPAPDPDDPAPDPDDPAPEPDEPAPPPDDPAPEPDEPAPEPEDALSGPDEPEPPPPASESMDAANSDASTGTVTSSDPLDDAP
jgi:hypothetical protein